MASEVHVECGCARLVAHRYPANDVIGLLPSHYTVRDLGGGVWGCLAGYGGVRMVLNTSSPFDTWTTYSLSAQLSPPGDIICPDPYPGPDSTIERTINDVPETVGVTRIRYRTQLKFTVSGQFSVMLVASARLGPREDPTRWPCQVLAPSTNRMV